MDTKNNITVWRSIIAAYEHYCKPLCCGLGMPQMAVDILIFLANNPELCTAKDISRQRGFKENILSVNINKLVNEGYLKRLSVEGDRRKVRLVCTEKAQPVIAQGRQVKESFDRMIEEGLTEEDMKTLQRCLEIMYKNAQRIKGTDCPTAITLDSINE